MENEKGGFDSLGGFVSGNGGFAESSMCCAAHSFPASDKDQNAASVIR